MTLFFFVFLKKIFKNTGKNKLSCQEIEDRSGGPILDVPRTADVESWQVCRTFQMIVKLTPFLL